MLLLIILPACPAQSLDYAAGPHSSDPLEGGWIQLHGENMISIPSASYLNESWILEGNAPLKNEGDISGNETPSGSRTSKGNGTLKDDKAANGNETASGSSISKGNATLKDDEALSGNETPKDDRAISGNGTSSGNETPRYSRTLNDIETLKNNGTISGNETLKYNRAISANVTPNGSWTYPFHEYPAYQENETISGTFWGNSSLAGGNASLCLSAFSLTDFLAALGIINRGINITSHWQQLRLNETGDAAFSLQGRPRGIYTLYLADNQSRTLLSAAPILVAQRLKPFLPQNLSSGQILPVKLNSSAPAGNYTLAALMMLQESYSSASLSLFHNSSSGNITAQLTISNQSLELQGRPKDYEQLLSQILTLLPEDSSAAMQESSRPGGQIYLLTDPDWHRGKYMLICAIYAPGQGLEALGQSVIEVV